MTAARLRERRERERLAALAPKVQPLAHSTPVVEVTETTIEPEKDELTPELEPSSAPVLDRPIVNSQQRNARRR